jgi:hypothetical protein
MGVLWTAALNGAIVLGAYLFARHGLRQPPGPVRLLAAAVLGWSWVTLGTELAGSLGLLDRVTLLAWAVAGFAAGGTAWLLDRDSKSITREGLTPSCWEAVGAVALVLWASVLLAATSLLLPVKVVSDGPIYHLYFAARWWKAGSLLPLATPFGENAATYFPANGDLWFAWLMIGWGGDTLAKVGQAPFLPLAGIATYAIAQRLGARRCAATLATCWFVSVTPLLLYSFEPNVDTIFASGYLLAAYFFLRHALGDDRLPALFLGALAAGLAFGTKATGIVFIPPLLALACVSAVRRGRSILGRAAGVLVIALVPCLTGGFWFARNAALTGNPLYPLHLSAFGRTWLSGWYGPDVMRLSSYYLPRGNWKALVDILFAVLDPRLVPVWLAALLGAWAWRVENARTPARWIWGCSALAIGNVALYWLIIPYRTQQRFMLHAVGLAAVPLAVLFERSRWVRVAGFGLLALHMLTPQPWPFSRDEPPWDFSPRVPNGVPPLLPLPLDRVHAQASLANPHLAASLAGVLWIGLVALVSAWAWRTLIERPTTRAWVRAALAAIILVASAWVHRYPWGTDARARFFPLFPEYVRGWRELDLRAGPDGARVAYAGNDLPYYLMGVGLRNEVRYINVDSHRDWLLHNYHRAAGPDEPVLWAHPRPGWDRIHADYESWLANLRAERIQLLVVNRVNPDEGPHNIADASGFPIERVWADAHPESFELLYGALEHDPQFRLYRLIPSPAARAGRQSRAIP